MNKKIKNIASVVQTKSAAVLCTLCAVLFLASCAEDEMADGTHSQKQDLRTVSVNFDMPADKPSFGDGTASRAALDAQPAEILLGDSTLAVSRAEGSTANYSTSSWANGDQLLVRIEAGSTQARLTLQFITPNAEPISDGESQAATAGTWYLMKSESYVKYTGDAFTAYNAADVTPLFAEDNVNDNEMPINGTLTMHIDYSSVATQATVSIIYAPDMQWSLAQDNTVSMEQKNPATTATTAPELWTTNDNGWTTPQARLRVNTGRGNVGDVVTLTSKAFVSALETKPQDNVYTATTDDQGDAYFYGTTNDVLKGNSEDKKFEIKLIQMRVPVPQPAPRASEGRSVALDDAKQNVIITLDTPITLLEASDVVPVTLAATKAYKLMAEEKRTAAKTENINSLRVIDGQAISVAAVKKQIETAVAMGITEFTVINALREYTENGATAGTVVGEAIGKTTTAISISVANATTLPANAFKGCSHVSSFTFQQTIGEIGTDAFSGINAGSTLFLTEAQLLHEVCSISAADSKPKWGNATWASITINNTDGTTSSVTAHNRFAAVLKYETIAGTERVVLNGAYPEDYFIAVLYVAKEAHSKTDFVLIGSIPDESNRGFEMATNMGMTDVNLYIKDATDIRADAFTECTPFTHITLGATGDTTIGNGAFKDCANLQSITLYAPTAVGANAFSRCLELTTITNIDKITSIGESAFCFTSLTSMVLPEAITTIADEVFKQCEDLEQLTFSSVITAVGTNAFEGTESDNQTAWTTNCDLTLAEGQQEQTGNLKVTAVGGKLMWAGEEWKSITVGGVQYKAVGNELYAVIDGTDSYLNLSTYVQKGNLKFYVVNGLSGITKAFTIDGTGASEGSISLVLDEGITDIPMYAFQHCNALGSVVANGVETIGYGAFSGTLAIRELTFKKVISCTSNYAFGQQPQDDYYWTFNCTLTLNESQSGVYESDDIPSVTWGSCFWGCIKIGVYVYYMRS